jgi:molecular chaperone HscB
MEMAKKKEIPLARSMCWHCQSDIGGEYFCQQCVKVQPLSTDIDYFTAVGLPRKLNIDTGLLETKFYEMSRAFHPDFYEGKTEMERAVSLTNSATLNQAYHTLKDPIERVEYLLLLEAGSVKEIPGKPPTELFETLLEIQEQLDELQSVKAQTGTPSQELIGKLRAEHGTLEATRGTLERRLAELFQLWDRLVDRSSGDQAQKSEKEQVLKQMRDILSQRNYLNTMLAHIAGALE